MGDWGSFFVGLVVGVPLGVLLLGGVSLALIHRLLRDD